MDVLVRREGHFCDARVGQWLGSERWCHGNVVLLGDAAHTAHFSIGSGTKLAMESAVSMANYLHTEPTMQAAFASTPKIGMIRCLRGLYDG